MKLESRMKNMKVKGKLNFYRTCMLGVIIVMGLISAIMSLITYSHVKEITEVWSPSLACIQELDTLASDYRIKQYGHVVAAGEQEMAAYEEEMAGIDEKIAEVNEAYGKLIVDEEERAFFENIQSIWNDYEEAGSKVLELSRAGKTVEAGNLMQGEALTIYQNFNSNFSELRDYANDELTSAKNTVNNIFVIQMVCIAIAVVIGLIAAISIGKVIIQAITTPVSQIQEAAAGMRQGDMSKGKLITYESEDELGTLGRELRESMKILSGYIEEISDNLREIAKGDLTKNGDDITDFLGDFSSIKESLVFILKRFNSTLTDIQHASDNVASNAGDIANASQSLSEGATDQASSIEELTATTETVSNLADESAKSTQKASESIKQAANKAEQEKEKMEELKAEMVRITEISKEIENIITAIEDIASQTNLLSLNASIEAARAGEAGKGFAVVADQIGKLATDSAQSAVSTRELIGKTLEEIERGNEITASTSEAFERVIEEMKAFADSSQQTYENVSNQAQAIEQIGNGIEQISIVVQNTAASAEENAAVSENLSEEAQKLDELVKRFKLF